MANKSWETVKLQYCHHACEDVCLEAEVVYPAEWLPDQPPRVLARRCSHGMNCNLDGRPRLCVGRHQSSLRSIRSQRINFRFFSLLSPYCTLINPGSIHLRG